MTEIFGIIRDTVNNFNMWGIGSDFIIVGIVMIIVFMTRFETKDKLLLGLISLGLFGVIGLIQSIGGKVIIIILAIITVIAQLKD